MRNEFLPTLLIALTGCAPLYDLSKEIVKMPDDVRPYYENFVSVLGDRHEAAGSISLEGLTRVLGLRADTPQGTCLTGGIYKVQIDPEFWASARDDARRVVVYHELTHCLFVGIEHSRDANHYMFMDPRLDIPKDELDAQARDFISRVMNRQL